jgi:hypothetical protein
MGDYPLTGNRSLRRGCGVASPLSVVGGHPAFDVLQAWRAIVSPVGVAEPARDAARYTGLVRIDPPVAHEMPADEAVILEHHAAYAPWLVLVCASARGPRYGARYGQERSQREG